MNKGLITIYVVYFISLLLAASEHGKERSPSNFWTALLGVGIVLTLVWWTLGWEFI